jgi:hypothetical protein
VCCKIKAAYLVVDVDVVFHVVSPY